MEELLKTFQHSPQLARRQLLELHRDCSPINREASLSPTINELETRDIFKSIFTDYDGIIFGETHFENVTIHYIADNLHCLKELGLTHLFIEGLYNGFEQGLNGKRCVSESLHEEYAVIAKQANKLGIKIIGLDHPAIKNIGGVTRSILFHPFAGQIINQTTTKNKWLALTGLNHIVESHFVDSNSFQRFYVNSLCDFTGGLGIKLSGLDNNKKSNISLFGTSDVDLHLNAPTRINNTRVTNSFSELDRNLYKINSIFNEHNMHWMFCDIDPFARLCNERFHSGTVIAFTMPTMTPLHVRKHETCMQQYLLNHEINLSCDQWLDMQLSHDYALCYLMFTTSLASIMPDVLNYALSSMKAYSNS